MNQKPKVSIIILNYNSEDYTIQALESMKDTDYDNYEIILIDNGSNENSRAKLKKSLGKFKKVIYKEISPNRGVGGGFKAGAQEASNPDYILFINNDIKITHNNWINSLIEVAKNNVGIVGCKLVYSDGTLQHAGGKINFLTPFFAMHIGIRDDPEKEVYNKVIDVDYVTGAAMLIKTEIIKQLNGFEDLFLPMYYEDTDFCIRAKKVGYPIRYTPNVKIIHFESSTTKKATSTYFTYVTTKNKILFLLLNMPLKYIPIRTIYEFFSMIKWVLRGQGKSYFKAVLW
ncbi:MAG: hypothetical protein COY63_00110, partial [Candidatus Huberarchaeum crystalense]